MMFTIYCKPLLQPAHIVKKVEHQREAEAFCFERNHPRGQFYDPDNYHYFLRYKEEEE